MDWMFFIALVFSFFVSGLVVLFIVLKLEAKGVDYGWFQFVATVVVFNISFAIIMSVIDVLNSNIDFVIYSMVTGVWGIVQQIIVATVSGLILIKVKSPKT